MPLLEEAIRHTGQRSTISMFAKKKELPNQGVHTHQHSRYKLPIAFALSVD